MKKPSFSKNTIIYVVGGLIAAGGNIILAPVYLRNLSSEDFGVWSQFNLIMQFLQPIMGWGLLAALSRLLVDTDENARGQKIAAALTVVSVLNLAIILIIIGVTQQPLSLIHI